MHPGRRSRWPLFILVWVGVASAQHGCTSPEGDGNPGGAGTTGVAGTTGAAGTTGGAGTSGAAGTTGGAGTTAAAGRGGTTGAAGGTSGGGTTGGAGRGGTTGGAGRGGTTGVAGATATGGVTGMALCTWPTAASNMAVSQTIPVAGVYDGGMKRFMGTGALGTSGQGEDQGPIFNLQPGATLQNVIIGAPAADGVHCNGPCTLRNVWWEDVGEDAATLGIGTPTQVMTIENGGARGAADKVFQHNGAGTMVIQNFCVQDFGKLYRSCGNCEDQFKRAVQLKNIMAIPSGDTDSLVGINSNYGDSAMFSGITIKGNTNSIDVCVRYMGNMTGGEPSRIGSGADSTYCLFAASDIKWMP
jgi:pectate lyase